MSKCMEKCESKFDPDECKKKGGAVINCNETFKKCQLYCTANCK